MCPSGQRKDKIIKVKPNGEKASGTKRCKGVIERGG